MKYYRVEIENREVKECNEVTKSGNPYDYSLIKEYKSFVHINPVSNQVTAYLCKGTSHFEAKAKAVEFLEKARSGKSE